MSAYTDSIPPPDTCAGFMFKAMRLAIRYTHSTPTTRQLMADYGMSRATAYRWVRAIKDAKGEC